MGPRKIASKYCWRFLFLAICEKAFRMTLFGLAFGYFMFVSSAPVWFWRFCHPEIPTETLDWVQLFECLTLRQRLPDTIDTQVIGISFTRFNALLWNFKMPSNNDCVIFLLFVFIIHSHHFSDSQCVAMINPLMRGDDRLSNDSVIVVVVVVPPHAKRLLYIHWMSSFHLFAR